MRFDAGEIYLQPPMGDVRLVQAPQQHVPAAIAGQNLLGGSLHRGPPIRVRIQSQLEKAASISPIITTVLLRRLKVPPLGMVWSWRPMATTHPVCSTRGCTTRVLTLPAPPRRCFPRTILHPVPLRWTRIWMILQAGRALRTEQLV